LSGKLKVTLFSGAGKDITVLGPGDSSAVPPGLYHKFEALEDCECLEFYRTYLQEPDIDRRTLGGIRK
jgi:mannose-6-phosphate isomerase-like protein (cupin superfamily)